MASRLVAQPKDVAKAFAAYQDARYRRTGRVQIMARVYGEVYHAAGVTAELLDEMPASRTPAQAYEGISWLRGGFSEQGA